MRTVIISLLLLIATTLSAQTDSTVYYNEDWEISTKEQASFYRQMSFKESFIMVKDFYLNDTLQMTGRYSSLNPEIQEGYFIWYYENGSKFVEGQFTHGKRTGIWTFWFPDGSKKQEVKFIPNTNNDFMTRWKSKRLKSSRLFFDKGMSKKKGNKSEVALDLFKSAIRIDPYFAEAYYELGLIKCEQLNIESGCADFWNARKFGFYNTKEINQALRKYCQPE